MHLSVSGLGGTESLQTYYTSSNISYLNSICGFVFSLTEKTIGSDEIIFLLLTCVKSQVQNHVQTQAPESALPWAGCSLAVQWK